jgi:F0F1-type ATP synthase assembly protein I
MNNPVPPTAPRFNTKSEPGVLFKLALLQAFGSIVFSLVLYYCFDLREALSAFFGGMIASTASLYSAGRLFTARVDSEPQEILIRFYISVVIKVLFTLAMVAICIIVIKVSLLPFIIAYLLAALVINLLFLLVPQSAGG